MIAFKGATAYEWQIGKLYGRICHLRGAHWAFKPWRRISFGWDRTEIIPVQDAEPLTGEPKYKADHEAEQGEHISRRGPLPQNGGAPHG